MDHASVYPATRHYLRAVAAGNDAAPAVMAKMRELPVDDFFAKGAGCASTAASSTTCIWRR